MSTKKVSYMKLLKEAISEFDTSKSVDVKGPMLDPILSYSGNGEMPTNVSAAGILERYYFQEDNDEGVSVHEDKLAADDNKVDAIPGKDPKATKKDIEDELTEQEAETEPAEEEEPAEIEESSTIDLENSVIEKLIAEMEDEDEEGDKKKKKEEKKPASEANREVGDEGAGTQAAGTGNADDQVPPRKDETNECKDIKEQTDSKKPEEEEEEEPAKTKDIDKEIGEQAPPDPSAVPGGPSPKKGEDEDELEEAFAIFKEQIEDEDEVEDEVKEARKISSDDIQV